MNDITVRRIIALQEMLLQDERYCQLHEEYMQCNSRFAQLLQELTKNQRAAAEDYLGVCAEMHLRMLEVACERWADCSDPAEKTG